MHFWRPPPAAVGGAEAGDGDGSSPPSVVSSAGMMHPALFRAGGVSLRQQ